MGAFDWLEIRVPATAGKLSTSSDAADFAQDDGGLISGSKNSSLLLIPIVRAGDAELGAGEEDESRNVSPEQQTY